MPGLIKTLHLHLLHCLSTICFEQQWLGAHCSIPKKPRGSGKQEGVGKNEIFGIFGFVGEWFGLGQIWEEISDFFFKAVDLSSFFFLTGLGK